MAPYREATRRLPSSTGEDAAGDDVGFRSRVADPETEPPTIGIPVEDLPREGRLDLLDRGGCEAHIPSQKILRWASIRHQNASDKDGKACYVK
jgi:hypothetical protein